MTDRMRRARGTRVPRDKDGRESRWLLEAQAKVTRGEPLTRDERHLLQQEYRRRERETAE